MPEIAVLRSGRQVEIRPIEPGDAFGLQSAFERLSAESRYQRFLSPKVRLTPSDLRYLTQVDGDRHAAFVVTPVGEPGTLLAVGRYVRLRHDPEAAEFAVTVGDPYQHQGLGTLLIDRLAESALSHGIRRLQATVLAENMPAHRLMHRLKGRLAEAHAGSIDEFEVELAVPELAA